jgi:hypothetical protein
MKRNPFRTARKSGNRTIGQTIDLLVEAFSAEGSGDFAGTYILEMAAKKVQERLPARMAEHEAIIARIESANL